MREEYKNLLADFIKEEKIKGRRERGLESFKYNLPKLFNYLEELDIPLEYLRPKEAQSFVSWLWASKGEGPSYSAGAINNILNSCVVFYSYLLMSGEVFANPFKQIKRPRGQRRLPKNILKEKEMDKLLNELSRFLDDENFQETKKNYIAHLVSELQYGSGIRLNEAAQLEAKDIDFDRGLIFIREGKGGASRTSYLNDYALKLLKIYLDEIRELLFCETTQKKSLFGLGKGQLGEVINSRLKKATQKLGYPEMTGHGFRHGTGFHLLRAGCDVRYIQEILGHRQIRSTAVYTKVEKGDLKDVLDACHPRKWSRAK
jgi:integrase/recombinase XerD